VNLEQAFRECDPYHDSEGLLDLLADAGECLIEERNSHIEIPEEIIIERMPEARWTKALTLWREEELTLGIMNPLDLAQIREASVLFCRQLAKGHAVADSGNQISSNKNPQNTANQADQTNKVIAFPDLPELQWEEITIAFASHDSLRIQARNITKTVTYIDMGFRDKRKGDLPVKSWEFLRDLAENKGEIKGNSRAFNTKNRSRVKELRKILRNYFRIKSDPFFNYKKCGSYRTVFTIKDDTN
jgi:hypothetical protein